MQYFFTSDQHYGHKNIIKYCNRPFYCLQEMDDELMSRHNKVVNKNDIVIHGGDFTLASKHKAKEYIKRLNGNHIFLKGSHDYWLKSPNIQIWERKINSQYIVVCHYAMLTWARSHYGSWQLYGHSHGRLPNSLPKILGKQHDIGVDNNNFYPVSFEQIKEIMKDRPNNPNAKGKGFCK